MQGSISGKAGAVACEVKLHPEGVGVGGTSEWPSPLLLLLQMSSIQFGL
jgi:hypothetical protein